MEGSDESPGESDANDESSKEPLDDARDAFEDDRATAAASSSVEALRLLLLVLGRANSLAVVQNAAAASAGGAAGTVEGGYACGGAWVRRAKGFGVAQKEL